MEIDCSIGEVAGVTGSARFTHGGTTVFCTVSGPQDHQTQWASTAIVDVRWYESTILNNKILEKHFSNAMSTILAELILTKLDPFKTICIELYISDACRNTLFCAINAAFLALADAGVPLKGVFCATSSFEVEEEVFVYFEGKICYQHAFGRITPSAQKKALDSVAQIQECLDFTLKKKLNSTLV